MQRRSVSQSRYSLLLSTDTRRAGPGRRLFGALWRAIGFVDGAIALRFSGRSERLIGVLHFIRHLSVFLLALWGRRNRSPSSEACLCRLWSARFLMSCLGILLRICRRAQA